MLDVLRVDDKKFSLSLSLYFGVVWKEHRLHLPPPGSNNSGASWLPIDLEFMSNLWVRIFIFSNFYCMLPNPNDSFSNLNSDCSNILDMRNLRKQVKKAFCYQKLLWPFTVWINCSIYLKNFQILGFQPRISKVLLDHSSVFIGYLHSRICNTTCYV